LRDQAENLRQMVKSLQDKIREQVLVTNPKRCRVLAVTSGKGGVGKTNIALGLAITLAKANYRVMLMDGDMGMANVNVVLGLFSNHNLSHVVKGDKELKDIILEGPAGLKIIPGGSGVEEMANLSPLSLAGLLKDVEMLDDELDYLFIDTGAGISTQVLSFLMAAQEILLVTTPEPTALTDAYGLIKVFHRRNGKGKLKVIMNMVRNNHEDQIATQRLKRAAQSFLDIPLEVLGHISYDPVMQNAVKRHIPYIIAAPYSQASIDTIKIASVLGEIPVEPPSGAKAFFSNLVSFLSIK